MNQLENNIDAYFKSKVDKALLDLNKEKAWGRLQKKRTRAIIKFVTIAVAASLIFGLILIFPGKTYDNNKYVMSDFDKRQKLKEYESKISGTYVETLLCFDCSGEIMESKVKQVHVNQIQLDVY